MKGEKEHVIKFEATRRQGKPIEKAWFYSKQINQQERSRVIAITKGKIYQQKGIKDKENMLLTIEHK